MSAYVLVVNNNRIVDLKHSGRPGSDDTINIPTDVKSVELNIFQTYDVRKIVVAKDNPYLMSYENCLISRIDMELIVGPKKPGVIDLSDSGIRRIGSNAFMDMTVDKPEDKCLIILPESIEYIGDMAFCRNYISVIDKRDEDIELGKAIFGTLYEWLELSRTGLVSGVICDAYTIFVHSSSNLCEYCVEHEIPWGG